MKFIISIILLVFSNALIAETRLCEKQKPFMSKEEFAKQFKGNYEYEKHIYELPYDEIKDVNYDNYKYGIDYLENRLPKYIKAKENIFDYAESADNFLFSISAIKAYTLKQRALQSLGSSEEESARLEFCTYLKGLYHHP